VVQHLLSDQLAPCQGHAQEPGWKVNLACKQKGAGADEMSAKRMVEMAQK
jgi:hypothetical protein